MTIRIPAKAAAVLDVLHENGHEAYVVGGCVRDALMGREPSDWDVTTSARPEITMSLFEKRDGFRVIPTGIKHGTVTVVSRGERIETTTFRIDGEYTDCRRPDRVDFTDSLKEDLARRDFTMNAIAYAAEAGICDPYGGEADIRAGIIRCVGDPRKRFSEDALRIMRAVRFASVLGFSVDPATAEAALELREQLAHVAWERIHVELEKLIAGPYAARVIHDFYPIMCQIMPELAGRDIDKICALVERLYGATKPMMLAALLSEGGNVDKALHRLRFSKHTLTRTSKILRFYRTELTDKPSVRRFCRNAGTDFVREIVAFGIVYGTMEPSVLMTVEEILRDGDCISLTAMKIDGKILRAMGVPAKDIGRTLEWLLDGVMEDRLENRGAVLKRAVRSELRKAKERKEPTNEGSTSL